VAEKAIAFKYRNAGQVCVAPQRFFVHTQIVEEFSEHLVNLANKMKVGNGLEEGIELGPLINARQRDRVENLVSDAVANGAQVLAGGSRPSHLSKGYFYAPTVISQLSPTMPLYHEEIFGPVLPIIPFSETEEAIKQANENEYGLAAFVMTNNLNTALRVSERLEYGMVCINDWLPATPEAPFGGIKQSGMGRETGSEGLLEYMETKTVFIGGVQ